MDSQRRAIVPAGNREPGESAARYLPGPLPAAKTHGGTGDVARSAVEARPRAWELVRPSRRLSLPAVWSINRFIRGAELLVSDFSSGSPSRCDLPNRYTSTGCPEFIIYSRRFVNRCKDGYGFRGIDHNRAHAGSTRPHSSLARVNFHAAFPHDPSRRSRPASAGNGSSDAYFSRQSCRTRVAKKAGEHAGEIVARVPMGSRWIFSPKRSSSSG